MRFAIIRTVLFPVVLCGCEIWSLTNFETKHSVVLQFISK
jgi:hypothetical protein